MKLVQGTTYEASIKLGMFESLASNAQIAEKLKSAGFTDVQVSGTGSARQARGVWSGGTMDAPLPSQVTGVRAV